jgi:hypothetical protein
MNTFTQGVWEVVREALVDDEALLADLKKLLLKDYRPFLSADQSGQVYSNTLKAYFLEKLQQWYEWLPETPINLIGGELALEAFQAVEWEFLAGELRQQFERERQSCSR